MEPKVQAIWTVRGAPTSPARIAALAVAKSGVDAALPIRTLELVLKEELALARRLHDIQSRDSRIGFEASNQYYYVPMDLAEKVINCRDLLDRWLPVQESRFA